jgi:hypothetical protein
MKKHEWRERTPDGGERVVRAVTHGGRWTVSARARDADTDDWEELDPVPLAVLEALRERLWAKYRRRRVAWEEVERVDRLIEAGGGTPQGSG